MTNMKLKKGDNVVVITGKDKGKTGLITKVSPESNRYVVAGVNMMKKATKPDQQSGEGGGILSKEASIHGSNVMLIGADGKPTRRRQA